MPVWALQLLKMIAIDGLPKLWRAISTYLKREKREAKRQEKWEKYDETGDTKDLLDLEDELNSK
jgi:hypothetical protein